MIRIHAIDSRFQTEDEDTRSRIADVIRSVILRVVFEDGDDNAEGEPDETLYHTLYILS